MNPPPESEVELGVQWSCDLDCSWPLVSIKKYGHVGNNKRHNVPIYRWLQYIFRCFLSKHTIKSSYPYLHNWFFLYLSSNSIINYSFTTQKPTTLVHKCKKFKFTMENMDACKDLKFCTVYCWTHDIMINQSQCTKSWIIKMCNECTQHWNQTVWNSEPKTYFHSE